MKDDTFKDVTNYHEVPADVAEDRGPLLAWARKTIASARRQ
jgi:hypothetical protein